ERAYRTLGVHIKDVRFRIVRAPRPVRAAAVYGHRQRSQRTFKLADDRRREYRSHLVSRYQLQRLGPELRSEIDQVVNRRTLPVVGAGLGWERLCRAGLLTGNRGLLHGLLIERPDRFTVRAVEDIE